MSLRRFSYVLAGTSGVFLCLCVYRMIVRRREDQAHKAIHAMVRAGAWYELRQFLETGQAVEFGVLLDIIKPDQMADGQTPLYIAAHQGHEKCVQLLLDAGAVVDQAMNNGFTPLHTAAVNGNDKCVQLLLGAGAVVDQAMNGGFTPLGIAAQNGHEKCVQLLLGAEQT